MRREKDLVEPVSDAHSRTIDARRRLNGNPRPLQVALDKPQVSWWQRYFKWETLTVAGRTIEKGWVVPQPLGIALLVVMLGGVGSLYWRLTDKVADSTVTQARENRELREMLIRIDQKFTDKDIHDQERNEEFQKRFQNADAWQTVTNRDMAALKLRLGVK